MAQRDISIRSFAPEDYPAVSEIQTAVYPETPMTPSEIQYYDDNRNSQCHAQRWVVERGGRVVAFGEYDQSSIFYNPGNFLVRIRVRPEYQGQGIGKALYDQVTAGLEPHHPLSIRIVVPEGISQGIRFLEKKGFQAVGRDLLSVLDVDAFDLERYRGVMEGLADRGIEIRTMRDLEVDPDRNRKLHNLENALLNAAPSPGGGGQMSFEDFSNFVLKNPTCLPDGYFVALIGGEYVGLSNLFVRLTHGHLWIHLTGVEKTHRRNGIALALKLCTIAYAKAHGYRFIKTVNDSTNEPMISINRSLGFAPIESWISFTKQ